MREWIETNGLGSYASLTYQQTVSRKFHGLLVASLQPPVKRWLFVSNIYDTLHHNNTDCNLWEKQPSIHQEWLPSFIYNLSSTELMKTVCMSYHQNTTILRYDFKFPQSASLKHKIVINSRHIYDTTDKESIVFSISKHKTGITIQPDNTLSKIFVYCPHSTFNPLEYWEETNYEIDKSRQDSSIEYQYVVGELTHKISTSEPYYLIITIEPQKNLSPSSLFNEELSRKKQLIIHAHLPSHVSPLVLSSDKFIVRRNQGSSILAGYHWFSDWGRDTLIALPGITLVTKRFDDAENILNTFSNFCRKGLIPNTFTDRESQAMYNTVDASLWYIDRVFQYLKYTNDYETLLKIWPTLTSIIEGYRLGTDFGIHMDTDGFISHGPGLTWMDVKLGEYYPTPRTKKAVEIQALWYNSLRIMSILSHHLEKDDIYSELADLVMQSFNTYFTEIFDVIDVQDRSVRPNQIFLASLDFSPISRKLQEIIVKITQEQLYTLFGLRTLSPMDPRYRGRYLGSFHRDLAYHNGTVWPWLLGPFITAFIKSHGSSSAIREQAYQDFIAPMIRVFGDNWNGSIQEIFDGDPPFAPRGCITQAWSVAEILRSWIEDIEDIRPPYEKTLSHEIRV